MILKPIINSPNDENWIQYIGKYMINMGAIETTTRVIIAKLHSTDQVAIFHADLEPRIRYLSSRYVNSDNIKHKRAMNFFRALRKHVGFRNAVAHSGLLYKDGLNNTKEMAGLVNFKPSDKKTSVADIISIEEMKGRVDESAKLGAMLLEFQNDFTLEKTIFT